jgi:sialic acid synthase SpsE
LQPLRWVLVGLKPVLSPSRADKGADSVSSVEPDELQRLCQKTRDASQAVGNFRYDRQPAESGSNPCDPFISC